MSDPALRQQVKEMLVKNLMLPRTADEIGDELPLFGPDSLGLDSIDALEMAVSMEKTFGVKIPDTATATKVFRNVSTMAGYIVEQRGNSSA